MIHTYKVSGMTCNGCVASVKKALEAHPAISEAAVSLESGEVKLTMDKHLSDQALQKALGTEKYRIHTDEPAEVKAPDQAEKSWLETYKPLLLIFFFLAGTNFLIVTRHGPFDLMDWMSGFMAGFFLVFSFFKFLDLRGFAESYRMYDLLAKRVPVYGYIYPFIELGLGIAYLSGFNPTITYSVTIIVMGFSSLGVIQSVLNKKQIRCACLGAVFNLPMSTVTIIEDLLMVGMAGWMLYSM